MLVSPIATDTDKPVSRQHEMKYSGYYDYPYYWVGDGYWGGETYPGLMMQGYAGLGGSDATAGCHGARNGRYLAVGQRALS